ncbi:MAG: endonuclease/exonuclease/phosphatase family protein [Acidobacteriia bacterium]|nr:endonuclease/exonuclease/phosphatase family protein [Terriglobia bacterium]
MTKAFSLASWNVEHFKEANSRVERVIAFLKSVNPDVFALYEVEGKEVFAELSTAMPSYQFHITEGPQVQEILVGVRQGLTAFFTQKLEFKAGNPSLRPGALLTITVAGTHYPILFLHTKSGPKPIGWGIRDDMLERALKFKNVLKKSGDGSEPNYIFLGDLNTMGMNYLIKKYNIPADEELQKLDTVAKKYGMRRLTKTSPYTWWNGPQSGIAPSNLDQVVAAQHLRFAQFGGQDVSVRGWPEQPTDQAKGVWIKDYSDHGLLYLEVQKA